MLAGVAEALEADMLDRRSLALLNPYLVGLLGSTHAWNGILNWAQELMPPLREGNMRKNLQFQRATSCSGQIIKTDTKFHQQASKPWTGTGGRMILVTTIHSRCFVVLFVQPNLSAVWMYQRAMSVRLDIKSSPHFINTLLSVNFQCMQVNLSLFLTICTADP